MNKQDSLKKRYCAKLVVSSSNGLINVLLLMFVPRVLGPANYGSFNFIRDTFQNIISLADLNLGSAHVNYAARKDNSSIATNVYFSYTLLIGVFILIFLTPITLSGFYRYLFPGQNRFYLFLGAILAYLMYLYSALMGLSDSKVVTFGFELRSVGVNIVSFISILVIYILNALNLTSFFELRIALYILLLIVGSHYLSTTINFNPRLINPKQPHTREIICNYLSFSYPLVTMSVVGICFSFFDRWFLQVIYGSVSQGFFSLAFSLSTIAGLFLSPMTPLLMQSIAKADELNDITGIKNTFDKVKFLYLISAFISLFFMFHTTEIAAIIGGNDYSAARSTILIMFLYPIHVVYGQFCGGTLMALRKTRLYRNISFFSTVIGFIISYFLLAPKSFIIPGLELNSIGLALKLVLIQFISVTIQLYFVCKHINEKISRFLISQVIIPIPIIVIGLCEWLVRDQIAFQIQDVTGSVLSLAISITLWCLILGTILWQYPSIAGLDKSVIEGMVRQLFGTLRNNFK